MKHELEKRVVFVVHNVKKSEADGVPEAEGGVVQEDKVNSSRSEALAKVVCKRAVPRLLDGTMGYVSPILTVDGWRCSLLAGCVEGFPTAAALQALLRPGGVDALVRSAHGGGRHCCNMKKD